MNATCNITEPRQLIRDTLKAFEDSRGWKWPIRSISCTQQHLASELADAMDFYYGGHELETHLDADGRFIWVVSSKGYYHYVGA